jgi:hypothetical protein
MKLRIAPLTMAGAAIALSVNVMLFATILEDLESDGLAAIDKVGWNNDLSPPVGGAVNQKPIDAYARILARPIFFKSREPFVPAPPAPLVAKTAPPSSGVDPNLILGGVMIGSNVRKAYLFSRGNAGAAWLSEGEEFMGWHIRSIDGTSAKLEQKDRHIDLQLYPKD